MAGWFLNQTIDTTVVSANSIRVRVRRIAEEYR
jgi:hypothetical protein